MFIAYRSEEVTFESSRAMLWKNYRLDCRRVDRQNGTKTNHNSHVELNKEVFSMSCTTLTTGWNIVLVISYKNNRYWAWTWQDFELNCVYKLRKQAGNLCVAMVGEMTRAGLLSTRVSSIARVSARSPSISFCVRQCGGEQVKRRIRPSVRCSLEKSSAQMSILISRSHTVCRCVAFVTKTVCTTNIISIVLSICGNKLWSMRAR